MINVKNYFTVSFFSFLLTLVGCQTSGNKPVTKSESTSSNVDAGKAIYQRQCAACHQPNGMGVPKFYPPLAQNESLKGDPQKLIHILLNGMAGEIIVNEQTYNGIMAPYQNLSDQEIADVLNYVRQEMNGVQGQPVEASQVAQMRK